jgi:hypothetical protein
VRTAGRSALGVQVPAVRSSWQSASSAHKRTPAFARSHVASQALRANVPAALSMCKQHVCPSGHSEGCRHASRRPSSASHAACGLQLASCELMQQTVSPEQSASLVHCKLSAHVAGAGAPATPAMTGAAALRGWQLRSASTGTPSGRSTATQHCSRSASQLFGPHTKVRLASAGISVGSGEWLGITALPPAPACAAGGALAPAAPVSAGESFGRAGGSDAARPPIAAGARSISPSSSLSGLSHASQVAARDS